MPTEADLKNCAEDEEAPSVFRRSQHLVTLKFVNVKYRISTRKRTTRCTFRGDHRIDAGEKVILKGVSGIVHPGEMLAILGPSGSGKTTLLTALGGRLGGRLSGEITYNGRPFSKSLTRTTGFVTQDDVMYPHLTVSETLIFTARLRLDRSISRAEKERHAMSVIKLLGLGRCKDSLVGGMATGSRVRGVSGGERKRVSIGQEMLINPSLLFLDEPTSGLDSTTAQKIVATLKELAAGRRTVVMTIHQPSSRIFYMFHRVMVLSDGNVIYFGKASEAMEYFTRIGHSPFVPMNPADFLLDLANGISSSEPEMDREVVKESLVAAYDEHAALKLGDERGEFDYIRSADAGERMSRWSASWWEEFRVLLQRGLKEGKHASFSALRICQIMFVTVLSGLLWWRSDPSHIQDQTGLLFFSATLWILMPMFQAIFTFPQERNMLAKERSAGMYRLSSFFMAKTLGDMPMELVLPTIFITATYWMGGLKQTLPNFLQCLLVILFTVLVAQGLGLALGALIMDHKAATTLGSICSLTFLLSGGYYVQHVPSFISWVKYISITHYTYLLLLDSQYSEDQTYECDNHVRCSIRDLPIVKLVGLGQRGSSLVALLIMLVLYRLIAYAALTRIGAKK